MGPGSAPHHFVPRRIRDTRGANGASCPGRGAALWRCTADPGPIIGRSGRHGSRISVTSLRAASHPGHDCPTGKSVRNFSECCFTSCRQCRQNRPRVKSKFANPFNLICPVQSRAQKHFAFHRAQFDGLSRHPGLATRGVSRSSRNVRRDAMDVWARATNAACANGEVVWSWRPLAGVKLATMLCIAPMTVTKTSWTPGRARRKP